MNQKSMFGIVAALVAVLFLSMPVGSGIAQAQALDEGAAAGVSDALGGAVSGISSLLTNTLSSDFIMDIVASISMRIGRVFGAGLFVASTDNIFFRVLEWIVAFTLNVSAQIAVILQTAIYIIPILSCVGVVTQPLLWLEVIYPLSFGMPFIFTDNFEGGFSWLNRGSGLIFETLNEISSIIAYIGGGILYLVYMVAMAIPCVNVCASPIAFIGSILGFLIIDIWSFIMSALMFLQTFATSVITDCVIISRAMCRALCGV